MFIELHILQNFAPSNLNRDETGTPKSCQFGDFPRARVSSQALKRAARDFIKKNKLLDPGILGKRSLSICVKLKQILNEKFGKDENEAEVIAKHVLEEAKWKEKKEKEESEALQFLGSKPLENIAKLCNEKWDTFEYILLEAHKTSYEKEISELKKKKKKTDEQESNLKELESRLEEIKSKLGKNLESEKEKSRKSSQIKSLTTEVEKRLRAKQTPDIAMFGRMLANAPKFGIDAASQVSHAISTHTVNNAEFDYFTAIDELKKELDPDSDAGAAMIGSVDFNSACYYRYANIDVDLLMDNLKDTEDPTELSKKTINAFLTSFVIAVPSGKQNSFASPTLPTFILGVIRKGYLCSLANAFSKPVRLRDKDKIGLVEKSIQRLTKYFYNQERMYGKTIETRYAAYCSESGDKYIRKPASESTPEDTLLKKVNSLEELVKQLTKKAFEKNEKEQK